jgi:hypothetical protein
MALLHVDVFTALVNTVIKMCLYTYIHLREKQIPCHMKEILKDLI